METKNSRSEFEDAKRRVEENLDNPDFVEKLNQEFIIGRSWNGGRDYDADFVAYILGMEALYPEETEKISESFKKFGEAIFAATDGFTKEAELKIEGKTIFKIIDAVFYTIAENGADPNEFPLFLELTMAGTLFSLYKLSFDRYQIDYTVSGQGLLEDTYSIDITFRPIPKRITFPKL
jgi:hypothetical protein